MIGRESKEHKRDLNCIKVSVGNTVNEQNIYILAPLGLVRSDKPKP